MANMRNGNWLLENEEGEVVAALKFIKEKKEKKYKVRFVGDEMWYKDVDLLYLVPPTHTHAHTHKAIILWDLVLLYSIWQSSVHSTSEDAENENETNVILILYVVTLNT